MQAKNCVQCLLVLVFICSCSAPRHVVVVERKTIDERLETEKLGGNLIRIVQSGDTLHAIAFGSGLNVNELASWNNLSDTSKLQVGRRIRLTKPLNFKPSKKIPSKEIAIAKPSKAKKPADRSTSAKSNSNQPKPKIGAARVTHKWNWPVEGRVIRAFDSRQRQQGIDIAATSGQAVVAAQAGEVVYVGDGLKGYGNLVIIKHDDRFLSAYAHNHQALVREGQKVKASSKIGTVGLNKQRKYALHFQIRKDGTPVNPITFLPKR